MGVEKLVEKLQSLKLPDNFQIDYEAGRQEFVQKFPRDNILNLTLEQFAAGTDRNSFCYWLEFKKILFGIKGGNASKFGIYRNKKGDYLVGVGENAKQYTGDELQTYFTRIKKDIIQVLDYAENDEIEKIVSFQTPIWNSVLLKILCLYYPHKFLAIGSSDIIISCARDLNIPNIELSQKNAILLSYRCKKMFDSLPEFSQLHYGVLGQLLWEIYKPLKSEFGKNDDNGTHYWLFSPGENGEMWEEFYSKGIIALGWDELDDLNLYDSKEDIQRKLQELEDTVRSKKNDVLANFDFKESLSIGDVIIVKRGRNELLGYGYVTSDYYYDDTRVSYKHCRDVEWEVKGRWDSGIKLVTKTLTDITIYDSEDKRYRTFYERLMAIMTNTTIHTKQDYPLNQILFGPPGTGKTYNTINKALEIIGIDISGKSRTEIKQIFEANMKEGQIVFTTFHQSMSYEDFIEGIKPETSDGSVIYTIKDGIFKQLCNKANERDNNKNLDDAYEEIKNDIVEKGPIKLYTPVQHKEFQVKLNQRGKLIAKPQTDTASEMIITKEGIRKYLETGKIIEWKPYTIAIAEFVLSNYIKAEVYEDAKYANNNKNYVLIIDEINRGNVSQIFGELITLIEEDKRLGQDEALKVTLPYSKETYGVPPNVYILGTMNTADRSVEALDTALRRRFSFEEIVPRPELIVTNGKLKANDGMLSGIHLPTLLTKINQRIEKLLDKDHLIGHSYFLTVETLDDLRHVFHNKILPLLQEYFFGDFGKIGLVVGDGFVNAESSFDDGVFAEFSEYDSSDFAERIIYKIKDCTIMDDTVFLQALSTLIGK